MTSNRKNEKHKLPNLEIDIDLEELIKLIGQAQKQANQLQETLEKIETLKSEFLSSPLGSS